MKAFSPAGPAVKAFFGYGAKTFGNPNGDTSGSGGPDGHIKPPPPTPPPNPPANILNVAITQNYPDGVALSSLISGADLALLQNGIYTGVAIAGTGAPSYWIISGDGGFANAPGADGFVIDVSPEFVGKPITVTVDLSTVRFYGGGGGGGNESTNTPGHGGAAIVINAPLGMSDINLTLNMAGFGLVYGAGGGGAWTNIPAPNLGGGGGAAGWNFGRGADGGENGGVFDPLNGGTGDLTTTVGGSAGNLTTPSGGGVGQDGAPGLAVTPGVAGFAVRRANTGATTITGQTATNVLGIVQ